MLGPLLPLPIVFLPFDFVEWSYLWKEAEETFSALVPLNRFLKNCAISKSSIKILGEILSGAYPFFAGDPYSQVEKFSAVSRDGASL